MHYSVYWLKNLQAPKKGFNIVPVEKITVSFSLLFSKECNNIINIL